MVLGEAGVVAIAAEADSEGTASAATAPDYEGLSIMNKKVRVTSREPFDVLLLESQSSLEVVAKVASWLEAVLEVRRVFVWVYHVVSFPRCCSGIESRLKCK